MREPPSEYPASSSTTPAGHAIEVTAGVTALPTFSRGIYVGVEGSLVVTMAADSTQVTFTNVAAGSVLPIRVKSVDGGTSASGIIVLY